MIAKGPVITEQITKLVQNGERYTTKLGHLVDDLLNAAKAELGELALNKKYFILKDVIESCCSPIFLDDKYKIRYAGEYAIKIHADQDKVNQVMYNLVSNAVKYAPATGEIIIGVERHEDTIRISVTDHGKGIPAEDLPHLFNRYYRGNRESQISGLGLGLYISSEIIKKHGGEIGVDSELGKGSTFWFTLPCEE